MPVDEKTTTPDPTVTKCTGCGQVLWGSAWVTDRYGHRHVDCVRAKMRRLERGVDKLDEMACDLLSEDHVGLSDASAAKAHLQAIIEFAEELCPRDQRPALHWPPTLELGAYGERGR